MEKTGLGGGARGGYFCKVKAVSVFLTSKEWFFWLLSHVWLFCDSVDYSPPGFSVHEILQARILEWAAIPFSRGSSPPRDQTWVSCIGRQIQTPEINPCIYANWYLTKVPKIHNGGERVCLKMLRKLDVNMQRNEIGTLSYKKST